MTSPLVGPPPVPPSPPRPVRPNHVLHLVLTLCTFGIWGVIWALVWWSADAANAAAEQRYRREWAAYRGAALEWQWRYSLAHGVPPPLSWATPHPPY